MAETLQVGATTSCCTRRQARPRFLSIGGIGAIGLRLAPVISSRIGGEVLGLRTTSLLWPPGWTKSRIPPQIPPPSTGQRPTAFWFRPVRRRLVFRPLARGLSVCSWAGGRSLRRADRSPEPARKRRTRIFSRGFGSLDKRLRHPSQGCLGVKATPFRVT